MQIQNPERFFVTGRSRIVDIVDEESGQRTINEFKRTAQLARPAR